MSTKVEPPTDRDLTRQGRTLAAVGAVLLGGVAAWTSWSDGPPVAAEPGPLDDAPAESGAADRDRPSVADPALISKADRETNRRFSTAFASAIGDTDALDSLIDTIAEEVAQAPEDALPLAWLGTARVTRGGLAFQRGDIGRGLPLWSSGLDGLARAYAMSPQHPLVLLRVAQSDLQVFAYDPTPATRERLARRGLSALTSLRLGSPKTFDVLPVALRTRILLQAADAERRYGTTEGRTEALREIIAIAPGSPDAERARAALDEDEAPPTADPEDAEAEPGPDDRADAGASTAGRFDLLVRADFFAGLDGDLERLDRAMALCEATLAERPDHAEALVWHGSGLIQRAGLAVETGDLSASEKLLAEGLAEMHRACVLQPDHVGVLIPRAATLIGIGRIVDFPEHERLALLSLGVYDYERTLRIQSSYFDMLTSHARGELLMGLADGWHQLGNHDKAGTYFQRIVDDAPGSRPAELAELYLEGRLDPKALADRKCAGCHH